jgi:hypothetical protein
MILKLLTLNLNVTNHESLKWLPQFYIFSQNVWNFNFF